MSEAGDWVLEMKNALLNIKRFTRRRSLNVITVDWKDYAKFAGIASYFTASYYTKNLVTPAIYELLSLLRTPKVICIGHSLGAQTCGSLGRLMNSKMPIEIIHGLDPAGPCFDKSFTGSLIQLCPEGLVNLNREDAKFVSIIHSNPSGFGSKVSS